MKHFFLLLLTLVPFLSDAQCMSGTYTIGGTTPDFATFTAATTYLTAHGVCSPVTFLVRDGVYNEHFIVNPFIGESAANPVTFISESGDSSAVIVSYDALSVANNYVVKFNGCPFVNFKRVTFRALSSTYANVLSFTSINSDIDISNCVLDGQSYTGLGASYLVWNGDASVKRNISFRHNKFIGGDFAVNWPGTTHDITFDANEITGGHTYGIYITQNDSLTISNCRIHDSYNNSIGYYCMYMSNITGSTSSIQSNVIYNIAGGGIIIASSGNIAGPYIPVINNSVSVGGARGIYFNNSNHLGIYHNSIYNSQSGNCFEFNTGNNMKVKNNSLYGNTGNSIKATAATIFNTCDYNDLFTNGISVAMLGSTGYTLSGWTFVTMLDSNSISLNPSYVSTTDLHATSASPLLNAGTSVSSVTTDIDLDPRNPSYPDIGCDEFSNSNNDAGVFDHSSFTLNCAASVPVVAFVRNYGLNTLSSVDINWSVNGVLQAPVSWSSSIAQNSTQAITLSSSFTFPNHYCNVKIWTLNPNGMPDTLNYNDTLSTTTNFAMMSGTYTIGGANPDYPSFTSAVNALIAKGICTPVTFNVRNGTYNEQIIFPSINGSSSINTITFQSESGDSSLVSLVYAPTASNTNYTMYLTGVSNITFQKMHFGTLGTSYGNIIRIVGPSKNVYFLNDFINSPITSNGNFNHVVIDGTNQCDSLYFRHDYFYGGFRSLTVGTMSPIKNYIELANNEFIDQYDRCIYLFHHRSPLVTENIFKVSRHMAGTSQTLAYIYFCKGLIMTRNVFEVDSATAGPHLLLVDGDSSTASEPLLVTNNFFILHHYTTITSSNCIEAGQIYGELDIWNNNFIEDGLNSSDPMISYMNSNNYSIKNNNFYKTTGGQIMSFTPLCTTIDYNNYYDGVNPVSYWQQYGCNSHSLAVNPFYISPSDLHIMQPLLNSAGLYIPSITVDIDGDIRNNPPYIGADEAGVALPVFAISASDDDIAVYPNPTSGQLNILFANTGQKVMIAISDVLGQMVYTEEIITEDQIKVNAGDLVNGTYILSIFSEDRVVTKRIVVSQQ
jgi:hypothetical protein